jgi:predicted  nucleic acid-binding Zn-ribbon protein
MAKAAVSVELSVEDKLRALYNLQKVDSERDKIKILHGELPLEVRDLEDEIAGLQTRVEKLEIELKDNQTAIVNKNNEIDESKKMIKKYEEQQNNVRNNREYDALSKEIEFQNLEIELCEKKIREFKYKIDEVNQALETSRKFIDDRIHDLEHKKNELEDISKETAKEEAELLAKSEDLSKLIEERLLTAYSRIRSNARNGLSVVTVERDACGGCFNKIPPQRQLDIRMRNRITVCEYCGRILVDKDIDTPLAELEIRMMQEREVVDDSKEKRSKRKSARTKLDS